MISILVRIFKYSSLISAVFGTVSFCIVTSYKILLLYGNRNYLHSSSLIKLWHSDIDERVQLGRNKENSEQNIIDTHSDNITKFIPKRKGTIDNIVKINTPYHVIAPKGVKFLCMPIPYPDSFDYESTTGILDPAESSEINIQLNWNVEDGDTLIKAGTPLMYMLPISEEKFEMTCRDATEKEIMWMKKRRYFNSFSFSPVRNKVKELYEKYFQ